MTAVDAAARAVLGAMMLARSAADECAIILRPEDFQQWQHADIFAAIVALLNSGHPTDVIAVTDRLIEQGDLDKIGGAAALHTLTSEITTTSNAGYHAEIVREASRKRRLRESATRVLTTLDEGAADAWALANDARAEFDAVMNDITAEATDVSFDFDDVVASLAEPPVFKPSPWGDLNPLIDGWRPGALYVIGARPGSGKSIMGTLAAAGLTKHGNVAMCSLEMSRREIILRLISARANVLMHALTRHVVQPHQWDAISKHRAEIARMPLFISDRSGVTMADIRAHVRSVARRGDLSGVVVDYLQLVRASNPNQPRWEAVGEITRDLKALAREYNVPVIALAQLNRRTEGGVARPTLADLRESGSIEQDADVVLLLTRVVDPNTDELGDELEVVVAKNRHGSTGVVTLFWEGAFTRVSDMSRFYTAPSNVGAPA